MKQFLLTAGLALALPAAAQDQPKEQPKGRPQRPPQGKSDPAKGAPGKGVPGGVRDRAAAIAEQLKLTPEQTTKVKAVFDGQSEAMRELFQNRDLSQEQRQEKMAAIRKGIEEKLAGILSADQLKQYKEQPTRPGGGGFGGGFGGGRGELAQLNLSEDQQAKVRALQQEIFGKLREVPDADRAAKYREANEELQKKLEGILTDEQKKKLKEIRANPQPTRRPGTNPDGTTPRPTRRPGTEPKKDTEPKKS